MISFQGIDIEGDIDLEADHTEVITSDDGLEQLVTMPRSLWWMLEYIIREMKRPLPAILHEIKIWNTDNRTLEECMREYILGYHVGLSELEAQ